jgi:hypothetical protein
VLVVNAPAATMTDLFLPWMLIGQPLISLMAQLIAATIVAFGVRRLPVVHALFASFVTGAAAALCVAGFSVSEWGASDPGFALTVAWAAAGWAINAGGVAALCVAAGVAGLTHAFSAGGESRRRVLSPPGRALYQPATQ